MAKPLNHRTVHTIVLHLFACLGFCWSKIGEIFQAAKHTKSSRAGRAPRESAMIVWVFRYQG